MFDVIWTDPNRELVGEHRARKEKKKEQKQKALTNRSSLSTRSSRSSVESPFGFLRSRGSKNGTSDKAKSGASSGLLTPSIVSSRSPLSIGSDGRSFRHSVAILDNSDLYSERTRALDRRDRTESRQDTNERPASLSSQDIINSRETTGLEDVPEFANVKNEAKNTQSTNTSKLVQTLGPSSYVTKRTEVTSIPRNSQSEDLNLSSQVLISCESDVKQSLTPPASPGDETMPITREPDVPVNLYPGVKPLKQHQSPTWITEFKPNNPDAWRPPEDWACSSSELPKTIPEDESLIKKPFSNHLEEDITDETMDLSALQKEVKRMAVTSAEAMLSRLNGIWDTTADPSQHQELEMEKKRWTLSALHHLDPILVSDSPWPAQGKPPSTPDRKVLALYESKVTTSYLAALHLTKQIYHISATPLSHALFPNVHPVLVPSVSPTIFPVAQQLFEAVYSISLPSVCLSQDIPGVLKNIYKCLKSQGSLQLTLIDPLPCADTLGHRMRTWLEENLLLNLEKNFRCMNPSKIFPHWLGDASLRGKGSTLTTAKFYAIPASARSYEADPDPFIDRVRTEKEIKAELRSLIGRMLWMEVWGAYVTGGRWWWDDAGCVEECLQFGTFWEYNVIEGVKDG